MEFRQLLVALQVFLALSGASAQSAGDGAASTASPPTGARAAVCNPPEAQHRAPVFPREALALGLSEGSALVQFTLEAGEITNVVALQSSHPIFAEAAIEEVKRYDCRTERGRTLHGVKVKVPFTFRSVS